MRVWGKVILPLSGGYNALPWNGVLNAPEPLRPTEFKGKWRWWLRILVLGGLGCRANYRRANKYVSEILGSTSKPSPYKIRLKELGRSKILDDALMYLSRIKLAISRSEVRENAYKSVFNRGGLVDFELDVRGGDNLSENQRTLAELSLALFLLFDGVGAMTNRGFGSIVPERAEDFPILENILREISNVENRKELEKTLSRIVEDSHEKAREILNGRECDDLPPVPRLSPNTMDVRVFDDFDTVQHALMKISMATSVETWMNVLKIKDPIEAQTWILGLPRFTKNGKYEAKNVYRRQSAFKFKILLLKDKIYVIVVGFKSLDWPLETLYCKRKGRSIKIIRYFRLRKPDAFLMAYSQAIRVIEEVL